MAKCQICQKNESEWSWQPFGPGENPLTFVTPGSHYRGFSAVKVCDTCKRRLESAEAMEFTNKGERYSWDGIAAQMQPSHPARRGSRGKRQ